MTLAQSFGHPMLSLSDGRDLLAEITQGDWRVGYKLLDIVKMLPSFVSRIEKLETLKFIGEFDFQPYLMT